MSGTIRTVLAGTAMLVFAACSDLTTSDENSLELNPAFQTVPVGFSVNDNSFDASGDADTPFLPGDGFANNSNSNSGSNDSDGDSDDDSDSDGFGGNRLRGLLMGGGLGPHFLGGIPFNRGGGFGPFAFFNLPDSCTFSVTTGRVTCPDQTRRGFTVSSSFAFKDAAGVAQPEFVRGTTNSVNAKIEVAGTKTRHDGQVTSTVDHSSDRTVTGLATGSTSRTVNGTATAHEDVSGTRDGVAFTAVRDASETTTNVVVPLSEGRPTIPTSGTIVREMTVSITKAGETKTKSRREEITFTGTNVINVKITQDGVTKNCTITLPRKKLVCE